MILLKENDKFAKVFLDAFFVLINLTTKWLNFLASITFMTLFQISLIIMACVFAYWIVKDICKRKKNV